MLLAGVFGGLINYYMNSQLDPDTTSLPRCIVVSIGAAFLVPVILDLLSSEIVLESQADPSKLLIFTGFCLIAGILSRFFISNISERILLEASVAKEKSENLHHDLRLMKGELLPLIDTETEQDKGHEENEGPLEPEDLDVSSCKVLRILGSGRYIFRSMAGLCKEADSEETTMQRTLNVLVSRGLAGKVSGAKGVRWFITEKGRRMLELI